jgi:chromosome partitioning protein
MAARIIAIANQNGGVGKTTTATNLGHGLALKGKRVLLVDCDPQGQVATFLGLRQESGLFDLLVSKRPLADVIRQVTTDDHPQAGLSLIPGDKRTTTAQIVLATEGGQLSSGPLCSPLMR